MTRSYSRAQAIADGILVDLAIFKIGKYPVTESNGFAFPLAITSQALDRVMRSLGADPPQHVLVYHISQLCTKLKFVLRGAIAPVGDAVMFDFDGCQLQCLCAAGDDHFPVLTIILAQHD